MFEDDLPVIREYLVYRAQSAYGRALIAWAKGDRALSVTLYEESDTAWRWVREIDAEHAKRLVPVKSRQQQRSAS